MTSTTRRAGVLVASLALAFGVGFGAHATLGASQSATAAGPAGPCYVGADGKFHVASGAECPVVADAPTPTPTASSTASTTASPTATATSSASPTATPGGPTPTPSPTPTPPPGGGYTGAFGSGLASGQLTYSGGACSNLLISGKVFRNIWNQPAIVLSGCSNVTVTGNDFDGVEGGVYCVNSTNVTVTWERFRNVGDYTPTSGSIGSGHSNMVQFNSCTGGYIAHNKGLGGRTEDMVSIYHSGGASASSPLLVEDNHFESPLPPDPLAWQSHSGTGSMVETGTHVIFRNNTYLNVGQGGLGFNGGTDVHYTDNILYGATRANANVGLYGLVGANPPQSNWEVARNRVWWKNASNVDNARWHTSCDSGCGNVYMDTSINPADLKVTL